MIQEKAHQRDDAIRYVVEEANTATRTNTPLIQVPQSVEVITRKVMEDQRASRGAGAPECDGVALGDVGQSGIAADEAFRRGFPCGYFKHYMRNENQNQALTFRDISSLRLSN